MPKSRIQKESTLKGVTDALEQSQGVVFTSDMGLTVKESEMLRKDLRREQANFQGVKKTLLTKALAGREHALPMAEATGTVSVAYSATDPVAAARIVHKAAKGNDKLQILGGFLEGNFIPKEKVIALASLPSRLELLGQTVGTLQAPISGFARVLAGNLRGLVTVLSAVRDQKN